MRVLVALLAAGLMVGGGNDGDSTDVRVVRHVDWGILGQAQTDPVPVPNPVLRAANPIHSIRIHGLATDGVAPPAPPPTPTILPTPAKWSVTDIICSYSWPCDQALAVARCESNLNPNAWNRIQVWMTVPGYGYVANHATGLFQMLIPLHSWRFAGADPYDAEANARAAHSLWLERGWQPWHASAHCSGVW